MDQNERKKKNKAAIRFYVAVAALAAILVGCLLYLSLCTPLFEKDPGRPSDADTVSLPPETTASTADTAEDSQTEEEELPENPVNFAKQFEVNDEIYAWIYVPNTNVNYPILQHIRLVPGEDEEGFENPGDLFYLRRGLDKQYDISGVIFTQSHNKLDFSDPVTLVYGHNMTEYGTMFATLHNFEDEDFFKENDKFYIFTPGHILTYEIVSAYKYDDRHIMNKFNFEDPAVVREYFDYVMNPTMIPQNVREGVTLKDDDRLVVLSTCMETSAFRYLVNGVLISDEETK